MIILKNQRVLKSECCRVTNSYTQHVATGIYAMGIDVIPCNILGVYQPSKVVAHSAGRVIYAGNGDGYGEAVWIDHGNGIVTGYGHMNYLEVKQGEKVKRGAVLGNCASTGHSTGIHLHFEVRKYKGNILIPEPDDFWNPAGFMDRTHFEWINPTEYVQNDLPLNDNTTEDYTKSNVPNRFKVVVSGVRAGAYTDYSKAVKQADLLGGVVTDGNNGIQIYPKPADTEDYFKSTIPNRFRVMKDGYPINAYTFYSGALSDAKIHDAHIFDSCNKMKQIY